jgi:hypothetical protein
VALHHASPGGPYLVVCPASVKRNWAREIEQATPGASISVIDGRAAPAADAEWTIVNYDILSKHVGSHGRVPWAGLVFDEAHYLKNHTSARSRLARQLAEHAATNATGEPAVYLLTGTLLTNRSRDLFVLLQLVGHSLGAQLSLVRGTLLRGGEVRLRVEDGWRVEPRGTDRAAACATTLPPLDPSDSSSVWRFTFPSLKKSTSSSKKLVSTSCRTSGASIASG